MKKMLVGATLALLSLGTPALAATTETYRFRGDNAYVSYSKYDDCGYSSVSVFGAKNVEHSQPGAPTTAKEATIYYDSYNWCDGSYSSGWGSATNVSFATNGVNSATLSGTIPVYDYVSETTQNVEISLRWNGTGSTYRGTSHSHERWLGGIVNYRYNGSYRTAEVSGTITMNGQNLVAGLSFEYANIGSSNSGSVQIYRR